MGKTAELKGRMSEAELSEYWGVKRKTLAKWRSLGNGPLYLKIGSKIHYLREGIEEYERNRTFRGSGERVYPTEGAGDGK